MNTQEFIGTFNEYYPFERYILDTPQKINYLFDDLKVSEIFIPSTEIKAITDEQGRFMYSTSIDKDEIYVKCIGPCGEIRLAFYDFADHIQEDIIGSVLEDMGNAYQDLYVEYEENEDTELAEMLTKQKKLITEKYGECNVKPNFIITDTLNLLNNL